MPSSLNPPTDQSRPVHQTHGLGKGHHTRSGAVSGLLSDGSGPGVEPAWLSQESTDLQSHRKLAEAYVEVTDKPASVRLRPCVVPRATRREFMAVENLRATQVLPHRGIQA
jgi:hypothetical protein